MGFFKKNDIDENNTCILLSDVIHSSLEPIVGAGHPAETWSRLSCERVDQLPDRRSWTVVLLHDCIYVGYIVVRRSMGWGWAVSVNNEGLLHKFSDLVWMDPQLPSFR